MTTKNTVISASVEFGPQIAEWKNALEKMGYSVTRFPHKIEGDDFLARYGEEVAAHYRAIAEADALFVLNLDKHGLAGYIGAGVFAEISFAIGLNLTEGKKIEVVYLNPLPEKSLAHSAELDLWDKLGWIKRFEA